jgi:hypothetical protein
VKSHAFRPFVKLPVKKAVDMLRPYFEEVVIKDQKIFDIKEKWDKVLNIIHDPSINLIIQKYLFIIQRFEL